MKKVFIPILAASISIVLSACSAKPAESTAQPAENEQGNTEVTPAAEKTEKSMFDFSAGDHITFGTYEQDNDESNGAEPISWEVLIVEDDMALIVSDYALEIMPYNENNEDVTWETCSLRKWLNSSFYENNFTEEEKASIVLFHLENPDGHCDLPGKAYDVPGGEDTEDHVFVLSPQEVNEYMQASSRTLPFTDHAWEQFLGTITESVVKDVAIKEREENKDVFGNWWLRAPGWENNKALIVDAEGAKNNTQGVLVTDKGVGIRPALWIGSK